MKNPYELLELSKQIRTQFNDLINRNVNYNKVIAIKDKYFNEVDEDYNFEGSVFQIGHDKAKEMLEELRGCVK